jgi:hypothetical protein
MVFKKRLILFAVGFLILTACHLVSRAPTPKPATSPSPPAIPTPILPTLPPPVLTNYLENVRVVKADTFDDPSGWIPPDEISSGQLLLVGRGGNDWHGLSNRATLREGNGVVINFRFTPGEFFEIYFERDPWNTGLYKRFGVYMNGNHSNVNIFAGRERRVPAILAGNLSLNADTWYSLLLVVGKGGDFLAVIWNPANPAESLQYREVIENWQDAEWTFRIQVNQGLITFDDFEEIEFGAIK